MGSRRGKVAIWVTLTVGFGIVLATGNSGDTFRMAWAAVIVALGVLTAALLMSGRNPWWTQTWAERREAKNSRGPN